MKTLSITKGLATISHEPFTTLIVSEYQMRTVTICQLSERYKSNEELLSNAELITDTFNAYNTTPILPSELLKQRNELLEALKVLRLSVLCGSDIQTLANCQQAKEIIINIENATNETN
jgi:hypothetical protein